MSRVVGTRWDPKPESERTPRDPPAKSSPRTSLAAVQRLQRSAGNRALARLLSTGAHRRLHRDVTVRNGSKLSASDLVSRLKSSRKLPAWLKSHLAAKGSQIQLSGQVTPPSDQIVEFVEDFERAIAAGDWTVTTGTSKIEVTLDSNNQQKWTQRIIPDLAGGEHIGDWVKMGPGDKEFSPRSIFLTTPGVQYGQTMVTQTSISQSDQKMVILVTGFEVTNPKGKTRKFKPDADALAEAFLHELSAHAGELEAGRSGDHGTPRVDRLADEIGGLFRPTVSGDLQPSKLTQQIFAFVGPAPAQAGQAAPP